MGEVCRQGGVGDDGREREGTRTRPRAGQEHSQGCRRGHRLVRGQSRRRDDDPLDAVAGERGEAGVVERGRREVHALGWGRPEQRPEHLRGPVALTPELATQPGRGELVEVHRGERCLEELERGRATLLLGEGAQLAEDHRGLPRRRLGESHEQLRVHRERHPGSGVVPDRGECRGEGGDLARRELGSSRGDEGRGRTERQDEGDPQRDRPRLTCDVDEVCRERGEARAPRRVDDGHVERVDAIAGERRTVEGEAGRPERARFGGGGIGEADVHRDAKDTGPGHVEDVQGDDRSRAEDEFGRCELPRFGEVERVEARQT